MAKSTGNVVNPFFALDRFGVDTMRYYLAHDGGITDDADYENKFIIERYKKGLQGGLGNLASRIMRGKDWNVQKAVERFAPILNPSGEEVTAGAEQEPMLAVGRLDDPLDKEAHKFHARLQQLPPQVETHFDNLMPNLALKQIMLTIYAANAYLQATSPWTLVSWLKDNQLDPPPNTKEHIDRIVFLCAESLRICGILLQPYMPDKAKLLLDMIGVDEGRRTWADARVGADATFGVPMVDLGAGSKGRAPSAHIASPKSRNRVDVVAQLQMKRFTLLEPMIPRLPTNLSGKFMSREVAHSRYDKISTLSMWYESVEKLIIASRENSRTFLRVACEGLGDKDHNNERMTDERKSAACM
ncbi:hypothetical protein LTR28_004035 [Elasticomyces elasticus]|nr:hypothetical protein LTR28_004035 [Elasticomyces elasticus]